MVRRRNEASRMKKEAREKSTRMDRERNLRLRNLVSEEGSTSMSAGGMAGADGDGGFAIPPMFAVKVVACPTLRSELRMNEREKRGRMFVERPSDDGGGDEHACTSIGALRRTIHEFFRRLKRSSYVLSASLPTLDGDGNVLTHADDASFEFNEGAAAARERGTWPLETDDDVRAAFDEAEEFFLQQQPRSPDGATSAMKRPTLVLHVDKDPNAPPPPPPPPYLANMPDPRSSPTITMLSFYSFPPEGVDDPEATAERLRRLWRPFAALGRIYVASEGINAQMAVPTNVLDEFLACCTLPDDEGGELSGVLGEHVENGMNVDPVPVGREEFEADPPFGNLHVRVRSQIVADGLERALDWQDAGYDMPPLEWHRKLKEAREGTANSSSDNDNNDGGEPSAKAPIVLDCRNDYETRVGKFELAEPLGTENFRDSWDALKERLRDVPKDAPIMTYCTVSERWHPFFGSARLRASRSLFRQLQFDHA